jgi:polysaccharide pyruvyl transferase WcaK-like protein
MTSAVLVLGGFGRRDAGAEARLDALQTGLPHVELIAVSNDPRRTAEEHGCDARPASLRAVASAVGRVDGVVVAGGDLLGDDPAGEIDRRLSAAALVAARLHQIPTVLLGVGVAGRGRRRYDTAVVRTAELVLLRDAESASVLAAAGVPTPLRVAADPAWRTTRTGAPNRADDEVTAVVVDGRLGPEHAADLAASVRAVSSRVRVVPWRPDRGDVGFARTLADRCASAQVTESPSRFGDLVEAIGDAGLVVTHRAHGAIAAAAAGRRVLAVGNRPEVAGVARVVGQAHLPTHASRAVLDRAVAQAALSAPADPDALEGVARRVDDAFALARVVLGVDGPTPDLGAHLTLDRGAPAW